jgi:DNA-directed RNA polymerase subunit F
VSDDLRARLHEAAKAAISVAWNYDDGESLESDVLFKLIDSVPDAPEPLPSEVEELAEHVFNELEKYRWPMGSGWRQTWKDYPEVGREQMRHLARLVLADRKAAIELREQVWLSRLADADARTQRVVADRAALEKLLAAAHVRIDACLKYKERIVALEADRAALEEKHAAQLADVMRRTEDDTREQLAQARREMAEDCAKHNCGFCSGHLLGYRKTAVGPNSAGNWFHEHKETGKHYLCQSSKIFQLIRARFGSDRG